MSTVCASKIELSTWRSCCSSRSNRIGVCIESWCACVGRLVEQVALGADAGADAHHDRLADRVDRRVGDLREELLEVVEQRRLAVATARPARRRCPSSRSAPRALAAVGASSTRRSSCVKPNARWRACSGSSGSAQRRARAAGRRGGRCPRSNHSPYGCWPATSRLTSPSSTITAALEVDEEELAGLQAALALDVVRRLVHHAGLRAEHDPAVLGLQPAAGAQAVAVQRRADHAAVGERDRGRAVPRLHQAGVEGVEALQILGQVVPVLVGLRDHHHHRVREAAAGQHEQLEHVVERRASRCRRGGRSAGPSAGRRRTARTRAATRARASS